MKNRFCIVVPVFNHAAGATRLATRLQQFALPVVMVNDGSDQDCTEALLTLEARYEDLQVVAHETNRGKGAAVLSGLRVAYQLGHTHAVQIDADGQHDADDIPKFLTLSEEHPSAVIAGRPVFDTTIPRGRLIARYLTHFWVWVETLSFDIKDSMCGFRVYPLEPVMQLAEAVRLGDRMDFDPEVLVRLHWRGVRIVPLPTKVVYPPDGRSHFRLWHDNCLISWMHTRLVFGMLWRLLTFGFRRSGGSTASAAR